jgi:hypothetical protein
MITISLEHQSSTEQAAVAKAGYSEGFHYHGGLKELAKKILASGGVDVSVLTGIVEGPEGNLSPLIMVSDIPSGQQGLLSFIHFKS